MSASMLYLFGSEENAFNKNEVNKILDANRGSNTVLNEVKKYYAKYFAFTITPSVGYFHYRPDLYEQGKIPYQFYTKQQLSMLLGDVINTTVIAEDGKEFKHKVKPINLLKDFEHVSTAVDPTKGKLYYIKDQPYIN